MNDDGIDLPGEITSTEIVGGHLLQRRTFPTKTYQPWYRHARGEQSEHAEIVVLVDADTLEVVDTESARWIGNGSSDKAFESIASNVLGRNGVEVEA